MLIGGIFTRNQQYRTESTAAHSTLLFLAVIGIAIPTTAPHVIDGLPQETVVQISHVAAVVMIGWSVSASKCGRKASKCGPSL